MLRERLGTWVMEKRGSRIEADLAGAKQKYIAPLRGRVLELGPGLGTNLPYLRACDWTGLEPSALMRAKLEHPPGPLLAGMAEDIPLPDASFDAVVSTLVFCSVNDARKALAEVRRVLKPGGCLVYIEHVAARDFGSRCVQQLLRPACGLIGCSPVRRTGERIAAAGFVQVEQEDWPVPGMSLLPHIAGRALA